MNTYNTNCGLDCKTYSKTFSVRFAEIKHVHNIE